VEIPASTTLLGKPKMKVVKLMDTKNYDKLIIIKVLILY